MIDEIDNLGYSYIREKDYIEFQTYTHIGEDVAIDIELTSDDWLNQSINYMRDLVNNYDIDDDAEAFIYFRGKRGIPRSIRLILESSAEKEVIYKNILRALEKALAKLDETKEILNK